MTDSVTFTNVAPVLRVRDLDAALDRYRRLGFTTDAYDGPARYGFVDRGGVSLHLTQWGNYDPAHGGATVYLYVSDADALYAEWSGANAAGRLEAPHDTDYGLREFVFMDEDGTTHRVGSPLMTGTTPGNGHILGTLRSADGRGVVRIENRFATTIDDVWSALTGRALARMTHPARCRRTTVVVLAHRRPTGRTRLGLRLRWS